MKTKLGRDRVWLEGAEEYWRKIDNLYSAIISTSEQKKREKWRRLRRQLFYSIHKAMKVAKYQGRLLRALGDATLKVDQSIATLLKSYTVSRRERDYFNCLLVADSLAYHFVEWQFDSKRARYWIKRAQMSLKTFKEKDIEKNIRRLEGIVRERSKQHANQHLPHNPFGSPFKDRD